MKKIWNALKWLWNHREELEQIIKFFKELTQEEKDELQSIARNSVYVNNKIYLP
jgi:Zn-finger protein